MNNTEQYRRECEARRVIQMSDAQREAHYHGCRAKRGQPKLDELLKEVKKQRRLMRTQEMAL
jgi:hypothetical protein